MSKPLNLLLGALATALVAVGVAAQTGTIQMPTPGSSHESGGVQAQQATSPSSPESSPSPSPEPTAAPVAEVASPPPADSPPKNKKKHGG